MSSFFTQLNIRAANDAKIPEILKTAKTVRLKNPNPKARCEDDIYPDSRTISKRIERGKMKIKTDAGIRICNNQ